MCNLIHVSISLYLAIYMNSILQVSILKFKTKFKMLYGEGCIHVYLHVYPILWGCAKFNETLKKKKQSSLCKQNSKGSVFQWSSPALINRMYGIAIDPVNHVISLPFVIYIYTIDLPVPTADHAARLLSEMP